MFVVVTHMHSDSNGHFSRFHVIAGNWWRLMEWFYCRQDALLDAHPSLTYTDDTVTSLLIIMPPQSRYGWSCSVSSVSQCPKWMSAFFSLCTNTERISMKYHQQINSLHIGWNCTRDKATGYNRKFELASRYCYVANELTNSTVYMAHCICRAGKSITHMQWQGHHMPMRGV